jgi:hypothetical protein
MLVGRDKMKKILKIFFLIFIITVTIIPFAPSNIFANGEDSYDHQIVAGSAGENTTINFLGTGYLGYYKIVTLYNNNSPDQIDYSFTIDQDNPWDLEMTNALPAGNYHYKLLISDDYDIINGEMIAYPVFLLNERHDFTISIRKDNKQTDVISPPIWVRDHEMTCYQVWINEDNNFEFVFFWEYANNNWVKIYDMAGNEVFSIDMEKGNARFEADLPDGIYTVKTFHNGFETPIQEFLIGKP